MQLNLKGLGTFIFTILLSLSMTPAIGAGCDSLGLFFKATMSGKRAENALRFVKLEKADEVFESRDGAYTPVRITGLDEDGSLLYRRGEPLGDEILRMDIDGDEFANLVERVPVNRRIAAPDSGGSNLPVVRAETAVATLDPPSVGTIDDVVIPSNGRALPARGETPLLSAPDAGSGPRAIEGPEQPPRIAAPERSPELPPSSAIADDVVDVRGFDLDAPIHGRTGPANLPEPDVPVDPVVNSAPHVRGGTSAGATDEVIDAVEGSGSPNIVLSSGGRADEVQEVIEDASSARRLVAGSGDTPAPSALRARIQAGRSFQESFNRYEVGDLVTFTSPAGRNTTSGRIVRVNGQSVVLDINGMERNISFNRINLDSITKAPGRDLVRLEVDVPDAPGIKLPVSLADEANLPAGMNLFRSFSEDLTSKLRTGNFSIVGPDGVRIDNVRLVKTFIENGEEVHIYKKIGDGAEELITVYPARDMLMADITEIAEDGTGVLRYRQTSPAARAAGSTDVAHVPTPLTDEAVELLESTNPRPSWIQRRKAQIRNFRDLIGENLRIDFKPGRIGDMASSVANMLRRGARFLGSSRGPTGRLLYRFRLANGRVIRVVPDAINGTRLVSRPFDGDDSSRASDNDDSPTPNPHPDIVERPAEDDTPTPNPHPDIVDRVEDTGQEDPPPPEDDAVVSPGPSSEFQAYENGDPEEEETVVGDEEERIPLPPASSGNPVGPQAVPGAQMNIIIKKGGY